MKISECKTGEEIRKLMRDVEIGASGMTEKEYDAYLKESKDFEEEYGFKSYSLAEAIADASCDAPDEEGRLHYTHVKKTWG